MFTTYRLRHNDKVIFASLLNNLYPEKHNDLLKEHRERLAAEKGIEQKEIMVERLLN